MFAQLMKEGFLIEMHKQAFKAMLQNINQKEPIPENFIDELRAGFAITHNCWSI